VETAETPQKVAVISNFDLDEVKVSQISDSKQETYRQENP
jgi:hypothetical protein